MSQSRLSQRSNFSSQVLPKKQQWAIIYQHKAMEMERAKSLQRNINKQKRQNFKKQLDEQLNYKHNFGQAQKEEDRKYYEYITKKAQQIKEKQQRQRLQRHLQRKRIQQDNQKALLNIRDPKLQDYGKIYNIQIGVKSEQEKKQRQQLMKKDVVNTLNYQRQLKLQEKILQKQHQKQQFKKNLEYQDKYLYNRNQNNARNYGQNVNVYNYYKNVYDQRSRRQHQIEHKLVDQAQMRKDEQAKQRQQRQQWQKTRRSLQMRDTLQKQIQLINNKKYQQSKANPQQASYSFIGHMFRQKKPAYDKRQYSLILQRQAQQQKLNKLQKNYMSDEEYKFNSNQLNKALNGYYTYDKYIDRSIGAVGEKINPNLNQTLQDEDSQVVKAKLQALRSRRNRSMVGNNQSGIF